jgi:hypothetical protein
MSGMSLLEKKAVTPEMCCLGSGLSLPAQMRSLVVALLALSLSSGCTNGPATSTSPEVETPLLPPPTEVFTPVSTGSLIPVPPGKPDAVDGTLSPGEWDGAATRSFLDGSELLLMSADGYLYLAIRAITREMIVANVFIDRGGEIAILHSSAALGTALYRGGPETWEQTQAFVWRCRRTDNSEAAKAERAAFLEEEHWVAANALMGSPNEMEYQIEMVNPTLRLTVTFVRESNPNVKTPWPTDLDDDCVLQTPGEMPTQLHLSPERWATIEVSSSTGK